MLRLLTVSLLFAVIGGAPWGISVGDGLAFAARGEAERGGPAKSGGMLYVNSGSSLPGNALLAFGLE